MHTYILIFPPVPRVDAVFLVASVSLMWRSSRCPQCWINPEMYLHLRIIHIQTCDNDSQINQWQELLLVVFLCTEGKCFSLLTFSSTASRFTANTLIDADTWAGLCCSSLSPGTPSVPVRLHTGKRCPMFVLVSTIRFQQHFTAASHLSTGIFAAGLFGYVCFSNITW